MYEEFQRFAKGKAKSNRDGTPMMETKPRQQGRVDPTFLRKYSLTSKSHPADFVAPFLPFKKTFMAQKRRVSKLYFMDKMNTPEGYIDGEWRRWDNIQ